MIRVIIGCFILVGSVTAYSQSEVNATIGIGKEEGTLSVAYGKDWGVFKSKKFGIGLGLRFTSYLGANQYYRTAPAKLTSGKTGPLVLFSPDIEENIDTFLIKSPQVNSLNLMINLRYKFNEKILVGFNIDAIGFSFGGRKNGNYINGFEGAMTNAKPTSFNILLTSDNDRGSLNSELYVKYFLDEKWGVRAAAQFHFTEYTTDVEIQQNPKPNDRFRNKSLMIAFGVTYQF
jgi:hypothetical protein